MKYSNALRTAAADTVLCVVHPEAWASIRTGAVGLAFVLLRLALLLSFPVAVPLMAWATWYTERDNARRMERYRARNGGGA